VEKLNASKIEAIVVTNSCPHEEKKAVCPKIRTIDIAPILAEGLLSCR